MPRLPLVNQEDHLIGYKEKSACGPDDINRVAGLVVYNKQREILIAKRVMTKQYDPGKWSYSVMGTVEEGETYVTNILKEAEEEIGLILRAEVLQPNWYGYFESSHKFFYTQFTTEVNLPLEEFRRQADEVDELRWVPAAELFARIESEPQDFVQSMSRVTKLLRAGLGW